MDHSARGTPSHVAYGRSMQILHTGAIVHARRRRWRVVEARAYDDCQIVTLSGLGPANSGRERQLLVPFDVLEPHEPSQRLRIVSSGRWRRACRGLLADAFSEGDLCAVASANIDLLPHQLEPAIAVVRGHGCRLLLADDVGLGKTIQAGVVIAELRARSAADRVLILTPAGLREQWAEELLRRFDVQANVVDFRTVGQRLSTLPYEVNPWTTWPIAIASVDYVKRAEVLPAVLSCSWDVLVVDEAHGLANDSDRHGAVAALAARAGYVLLLTATPHNGDGRAFRTLCGIGGHDRLLVFRRTRQALRRGHARHIHRLLVRPSADERRMHARLADFCRAVRAEHGDGRRELWLGLAVLHKRAFSSAHALQLTVERRLATLASDAGRAQQLSLPLDEHGETDADDDAAAWTWTPAIAMRDEARERRLLTSLSAAAEAAAAKETKLSALARLLNRMAEPAIVFTEYRDTLLHLAQILRTPVVVLHGGLSRQERTAALRMFAAGGRMVLLATDAAGEGLNLHHTCRTVINLELPWNPMRLEQRIGRVDRIGQRRTVHAFHLIAAGTGEQRLLADLHQRVARAQTDVGAPNPLGGFKDAEQLAAELVVGDVAVPLRAERETPPEPSLASYEADGQAEAARLAGRRAFSSVVHDRSWPARSGGPRPLATVARNSSTRARLGMRILLIWDVAIEDGCGRLVASQALATAVSMTRLPAGRADVQWIDSVAGHVTATFMNEIEAATASWRTRTLASVRSFVEARVAREHAVAALLDTAVATAFQPGMFDRRGHHAQAAARTAREHTAGAIAKRLAMLERRAVLATLPPVLRLVLIP